MTEYTPSALHDALAEAFARRGWTDDGTAIPAIVKAAQNGVMRGDELARRVPSTFLSRNDATRTDLNNVLRAVVGEGLSVSAPTTGTVVQVSGGTNVTVAVGSIIGRIENRVTDVSDQVVRESLSALAKALQDDGTLDHGDRLEALESVEYLTEQAALPPAERACAAIKQAVRGLARTAEVSAALLTIWQHARPPIMKYFGL